MEIGKAHVKHLQCQAGLLYHRITGQNCGGCHPTSQIGHHQWERMRPGQHPAMQPHPPTVGGKNSCGKFNFIQHLKGFFSGHFKQHANTQHQGTVCRGAAAGAARAVHASAICVSNKDIGNI